jgi:hypothetical protein
MATLFRRHRSDCTQHYEKERRIYEHDSTRATKRAQCECTIFAEGKLGNGKYLKQKSAGTNDSALAREKVTAWESEPAELAGLEQTSAVESISDLPVPIADAVADFMAVKRANGSDEPRMAQYRTLLEARLLLFARHREIKIIQQTDNAKFWSDFRLSWKTRIRCAIANPVKGS